MRDEVTLRLPPSLLVKLERRAARLEMSRDTYIASILKRALEDGHPINVEAGFDDQSGKDIEARASPETGPKTVT